MTAERCFVLLALVAVGGAALGGGACWALGLAFPAVGAWLCLGGAALLAAAAGTPVLHRQLQAMAQAAANAAAAGEAAQAEAQRRLRHDLRGVLSPALLTADRLLTHADPAVKRAGDIMASAVERAAELLDDTAKASPKPSLDPPGGL